MGRPRRPTEPEAPAEYTRAAQYVRMSTEEQIYSIENQAIAIAHMLRCTTLTSSEVISTRQRAALRELINDVKAGQSSGRRQDGRSQ